MRMKPGRLSFSPALPCVDCRELTTQGLTYPMRSLVWQLLPLCDEHIAEPTDSAEPVSLSTLRSRIDKQLAVIQQFQRKRRHLARAYLYRRRQHAHSKARRALRIGLNHASRRQVKMREEGLL